MSVSDRNRERNLHLWGWILFIVCAGFFIASGVAGGNILGIVGSIIFLLACMLGDRLRAAYNTMEAHL